MLRFIRKAAFVFITAFILVIPALQAQMLNLYSDSADAHQQIAQAIVAARQANKHVILDFGGNWCGDCKVLDYYFHQPPNLDLLLQNYVLVHISVGSSDYDRNIDIAKQYEVPIKTGVPALAVLDGHGKLLYSQKNREFEKMNRVTPESVTKFLNQWKPKKKA